MPYISPARREQLQVYLQSDTPKTPGELNYIFTVIIKSYMDEKGESYQHYNDVMGALEGAKLELYRRQIIPYEDEAIMRNGDI